MRRRGRSALGVSDLASCFARLCLLRGIAVKFFLFRAFRVLAPSAGSRRCSDMAAVGGTPDGRWTWLIPPLLTLAGHELNSDQIYSNCQLNLLPHLAQRIARQPFRPRKMTTHLLELLRRDTSGVTERFCPGGLARAISINRRIAGEDSFRRLTKTRSHCSEQLVSRR
jgi:hypothetical protein